MPKTFLVSLAIEFGPVTTFFVGALVFNFFVGVVLLMLTTVGAVAFSLWRDGRVPLFSLIASVFVLISGAATLATRDPYWVVLEFGLYNALFGIAMGVGYLRDTPALKPLFQTMFHITDKGWHTLSLRWGVFFILTALGSELVWRMYSYDVWVYYRFAMVIALGIFGFSQFYLARRERLPDASPWGLRQ
ncbi:septation protein IspZ [Patescibacteria group bacterium]|nr:septation protein IspZ [Patescibacteria group bacterium]